MIHNFIQYFMSGQILIDFGSWIWNGMLLGWSKGLWEWHQKVSEVPWLWNIDVIASFCVAVFLIACIWLILSIVFASLWTGLAFCWLFVWAIYLICIFVVWFVVDVLGTLLGWVLPPTSALIMWLWHGVVFIFKWIIILFIPGIAAAALLTVIYENYGGINSIWYVWAWITITATIAVMPIGWFAWHYAVMLLFFFGTSKD